MRFGLRGVKNENNNIKHVIGIGWNIVEPYLVL